MNHSLFSVPMKSFFVVFFFLLLTPALGQRSIPAHEGKWVHDEAGIFSASAKAQLEAILQAHRDSTSNQIAVLVIPNLEGEDIEGYAVRVFAAWKLGQAGKDNGVLFVVAKDDRRMRIEVGYGLEGVLTDAMSSRINRNEVVPYFRQGNYEAGILAGTMAIIKTIAGEYVNDAPQVQQRRKKSPWGTVIFFVIMLLLMSRKNKGGGSGMGGYWTAAMMGSMLGGSGRSSGGWGGGGGGGFGGGGFSGGGGSSSSW